MHHHLYYLHPTWTADGRYLICVRYDRGERKGAPEEARAPCTSPVANLVAVEDATGAYRVLTEREDLYGFSGCPSADGAGVFFNAGHQMLRVEVAPGSGGAPRVLADFGAGVPGNCALSGDGAWVVTCVRRDGANCITAVAADGSGVRQILRTEREVGHVQFEPGPRMRVLYSGSLTERMWMVGFDGRGDRLLYPQSEGEFLLHEFWARDGSGDVFVVHWPFALRRLAPDDRGGVMRTVVEMNTWHVSSAPDGRMLVCDTNHPDTGLHLVDPANGATSALCASAASNMGTQWRYTFPREGAHMDVTMLGARLSTAETPWGPQWTHPHPSFSPDGRRVAFTSDRSGRSQVYVVEAAGRGR